MMLEKGLCLCHVHFGYSDFVEYPCHIFQRVSVRNCVLSVWIGCFMCILQSSISECLVDDSS